MPFTFKLSSSLPVDHGYSAMENSQDVEVELYEELVGDLNPGMSISPSSSTIDVTELPIPYTGNAENLARY